MKQLTAFFLLAYLVSWSIWLPLYLPAFGVANLPSLPFHHGWGGFGPMVAAFIATYIFEKKAGIATLAKAMVKWRPLLYVAIALFSPLLLTLLAGLLRFAVDGHAFELSGLGVSSEFPAFSALEFFGYNLLFFGWGEETGWRGFALPRLQRRYPALAATLILTVFWALWHLPLFFYRPGYVTMDAAGITGWFFSLLTGSVLLSWLFNSSKGSVLACAIFHATVDLAFTSDFSDQNIVQYTGMLITIWGVAVIMRFKAKHLSRATRVTNL